MNVGNCLEIRLKGVRVYAFEPNGWHASVKLIRKRL